uniref:RRM domain-containing protein n=1 Tax=Plectus sambesii TaxID=2011161 RepID=A0A914XMI8_9BILA
MGGMSSGFMGGGGGMRPGEGDPLPIAELPKKKFTGRCRLFVGNLPMDVKEAELKALFAPHGEISECFLSGKGFAFLRLDTRAHAESAKEAVDGTMMHGRPIRVRFAVHGAAVRVKELSPYVSNELLYQAFSNFGEVERAVHIVDEKGRPTGEGIVEFERKPSANDALRQCKENTFLLTMNPKPIVVEPMEPRDEDDGLSERMIPRTQAMAKEREMGPRFANPGSFELMFGQRWKELFEMEKVKREQLEAELKESRERLENDMELAYQDYQTQLLREDLERRQQELDRLEAAKRERMEIMSRRRDEERMGMQMGGGVMRGRGPPRPDDMPFYGGGGGPQGPHRFGPSGPVDFGGPRFGGPGPLMDNMPPFAGPPPQQNQQGRPDPNLVQGVQKLLQMFKGGQPNQNGPPDQGPNGQMKPDGIEFFGGMGGGGMPPPGHGGFGGGDFGPPGKRRRH